MYLYVASVATLQHYPLLSFSSLFVESITKMRCASRRSPGAHLVCTVDSPWRSARRPGSLFHANSSSFTPHWLTVNSPSRNTPDLIVFIVIVCTIESKHNDKLIWSISCSRSCCSSFKSFNSNVTAGVDASASTPTPQSRRAVEPLPLIVLPLLISGRGYVFVPCP